MPSNTGLNFKELARADSRRGRSFSTNSVTIAAY